MTYSRLYNSLLVDEAHASAAQSLHSALTSIGAQLPLLPAAFDHLRTGMPRAIRDVLAELTELLFAAQSSMVRAVLATTHHAQGYQAEGVRLDGGPASVPMALMSVNTDLCKSMMRMHAAVAGLTAQADSAFSRLDVVQSCVLHHNTDVQ